MARDFNQNRVTNANLGRETLNKFGANFAINYGLDGFNIVDIQTSEAPSNIVEYFEGNDTYEVFGLPNNITKLCEYALASFPNITDLYLFSGSVIDIEDDLSYLTNLASIYVLQDLLSAYQTRYANVPNILNKLITIPVDYELTIPVFDNIGNVLNNQAINYFLSGLSQAQKDQCSKLIISTDYVSYYEEVWHFNFNQDFENLNNNIWYGTTQIDFTKYIIQGSGTLTSEKVEISLNNISIDKLSEITKIEVPVEFTSYAYGALDIIDNYNMQIQSFVFNIPTFMEAYRQFINGDKLFNSIEIQSLTNINFQKSNTNSFARFSKFVSNSLITATISIANTINGFEELHFPNLTTLSQRTWYGYSYIKRAYLPSLTTLNSEFANGMENVGVKYFIGTDNCSLNIIDKTHKDWKAYFKANKLQNYIISNNWSDFPTSVIGILDGNNVYTDKGFSYPKLSSTLTIDSNGHLIENGIDLFSGYTATWYSDEDCTIIIQPSNIDESMTVYVKITA